MTNRKTGPIWQSKLARIRRKEKYLPASTAKRRDISRINAINCIRNWGLTIGKTIGKIRERRNRLHHLLRMLKTTMNSSHLRSWAETKDRNTQAGLWIQGPQIILLLISLNFKTTSNTQSQSSVEESAPTSSFMGTALWSSNVLVISLGLSLS